MNTIMKPDFIVSSLTRKEDGIKISKSWSWKIQ